MISFTELLGTKEGRAYVAKELFHRCSSEFTLLSEAEFRTQSTPHLCDTKAQKVDLVLRVEKSREHENGWFTFAFPKTVPVEAFPPKNLHLRLVPEVFLRDLLNNSVTLHERHGEMQTKLTDYLEEIRKLKRTTGVDYLNKIQHYKDKANLDGDTISRLHRADFELQEELRMSRAAVRDHISIIDKHNKENEDLQEKLLGALSSVNEAVKKNEKLQEEVTALDTDSKYWKTRYFEKQEEYNSDITKLNKQLANLQAAAEASHKRENDTIQQWDQHTDQVCDALGPYYHDDGAGYDYENIISAIEKLREVVVDHTPSNFADKLEGMFDEGLDNQQIIDGLHPDEEHMYLLIMLQRRQWAKRKTGQ